ncbi:MAG: NTP transferase domain-containing protein [Verrucomicrobia bacterium]|nr:NTP transferase domain-containing protein [Verrucomicrobiota bacterium]
MRKAFVLGAGLGTRLRPLTDWLPKPLIPVVNRPLVTWAFDSLLAAGTTEFIVNTHHLADAWLQTFPEQLWQGRPIRFVHEHPEILETGGGIANIAPLVRDASFWVYNGDILSDLPLAAVERFHREEGHLATLVLRSSGPNPNVTFDAATGKVRDLRQALGTRPDRLHQFTGIYLVHPDFLSFVRPVRESVVPAFLRAITEHDRLGGIVVDEGDWWDLGDSESYLDATMALVRRGSFLGQSLAGQRIAPGAQVDPAAEIDGLTVLGEGCRVGPNVRLEECIVWPRANVEAGARLQRGVIIP